MPPSPRGRQILGFPWGKLSNEMRLMRDYEIFNLSPLRCLLSYMNLLSQDAGKTIEYGPIKKLPTLLTEWVTTSYLNNFKSN
jgi:hypothetical protein